MELVLSLDGLEDLGLRESSVLLGLHVLQLRGLAGDPANQQQQKGYEQRGERRSVNEQWRRGANGGPSHV